MKVKNLFITFGLSLALGVVAAVGAGQKVERVQATSSITGVWLKGDFNGWGETDPLLDDGHGNYVLSKKLSVNDQFKIYITGETEGDTRWVGYGWNLDDCDYEFVGSATGDDPNYKALTNYTLKFTVKSTFYTNWGSDVSIRLNESRTVKFVDSAGADIEGTDNLVEESNQFSGLITTTVANTKIKIKDTIISTSNTYAELEDGVTVATISDGCISITTPSTYVVYFKKSTHKCWIQEAEASQIAYVYANYFLNNVGCDPDGLATPTGWETCATRYGQLADAAKNYIYEAEEHWKVNDDLYKMIERYNWAINHNPNSLSHFIKNSSGTERVVPAAIANAMYNYSSNSNGTIIIVAIVASLALITVAGCFLIKRKHN